MPASAAKSGSEIDVRPGPAFNPNEWVRGYSREQIHAHVAEALSIYAELDELFESEHDAAGIPPSIAPAVFSTIQTMVASIEPTPDAIRRAQTKAQLAGATVGPLGTVGG